jgi:hypothetical protein
VGVTTVPLMVYGANGCGGDTSNATVPAGRGRTLSHQARSWRWKQQPTQHATITTKMVTPMPIAPPRLPPPGAPPGRGSCACVAAQAVASSSARKASEWPLLLVLGAAAAARRMLPPRMCGVRTN